MENLGINSRLNLFVKKSREHATGIVRTNTQQGVYEAREQTANKGRIRKSWQDEVRERYSAERNQQIRAELKNGNCYKINYTILHLTVEKL